MATKAKKANQQNLRDKERAKRLNRIRGMAGNFALTDIEAEFYYRALRSKETPAEFLAAASADIIKIIDSFNVITDIAKDTILMDGLAVHNPELHKAVSNNHKFLQDCIGEVAEINATNESVFADLGTTPVDLLTCGDAIAGFSNLQDNLATNAESLMLTVRFILETYVAIEQANTALEAADKQETENDN